MAADSTQTFRALTEVVNDYFGVSKQTDIGKVLGLGQNQISNWLRNPGPTKRTWRKLFRRLVDQAARELVWPIVEYAAVNPVKHGTLWRLSHDKKSHDILVATLNHDGWKSAVYAFHDSSYATVYVGKTDNDIPFEIRQRLNQRPNRVVRSPAAVKTCSYGHMTRFVSAYGVATQSATKNLETLLLRTFANNIANANSGHFTWGR